MRPAPPPFIVPLAMLGVVLMASLVVLHDPPRARADIDSPGARTSRGFIARNVILGEAIVVCTDDYPNATAGALDLWNTGLRGRGFVAGEVFRGDDCDTPPMHVDRVSYVSVEAHRPGDRGYYCRESYNGCFLIPPRAAGSLHTYAGHLVVIMNEARRDPGDDGAGASDAGFRRNQRTIAHELGHVLGLADYFCDEPKYDDVSALMTCSRRGAAQDLTATDYTDYATVYRPHLVAPQRDSSGNAVDLAVPVTGKPGHVLFRFDASGVKVEKNIAIRQKNSDGTWSQSVLQSFGPEAGASESWDGCGPAPRRDADVRDLLDDRRLHQGAADHRRR